VASLWIEADRKALLARVDKLSASSTPRWGQFDAPRMVAHLTDSMRMALGEVKTKRRPGPLRLPGLRQLVMFHLPWPKGAPTAPELLSRPPADWKAEVRQFREAVGRLVTRSRDSEWPEHPAFGSMSGDDWGRLAYRHIDHHLGQFGV
jgi:hypothetical protein